MTGLNVNEVLNWPFSPFQNDDQEMMKAFELQESPPRSVNVTSEIWQNNIPIDSKYSVAYETFINDPLVVANSKFLQVIPNSNNLSLTTSFDANHETGEDNRSPSLQPIPATSSLPEKISSSAYTTFNNQILRVNSKSLNNSQNPIMISNSFSFSKANTNTQLSETILNLEFEIEEQKKDLDKLRETNMAKAKVLELIAETCISEGTLHEKIENIKNLNTSVYSGSFNDSLSNSKQKNTKIRKAKKSKANPEESDKISNLKFQIKLQKKILINYSQKILPMQKS